MEHKGSLFLNFNKKQTDLLFKNKQSLRITSESKDKQIVAFQCEPKGDLLFELISFSPSTTLIRNQGKIIGRTTLSLDDLMNPISILSVEKWFDMVPCDGMLGSNPISLRIAISFTIPVLAPHVLHLAKMRPFFKNSCLFPVTGRVLDAKSWTSVVDEAGNEVFSVQMRCV